VRRFLRDWTVGLGDTVVCVKVVEGDLGFPYGFKHGDECAVEATKIDWRAVPNVCELASADDHAITHLPKSGSKRYDVARNFSADQPKVRTDGQAEAFRSVV
jgi:hypothetical protein